MIIKVFKTYKEAYMTELKQKLFEAIWNLPTRDIHTHICADHPAARGLHDIILYHMIDMKVILNIRRMKLNFVIHF